MSITRARSGHFVSQLGAGATRRQGWRLRGRNALSAFVTVALVAGTVLATEGVAAAAGPAAQSQGQFLSGTVVGGNLATLAALTPANASAPPDTTNDVPISASVLNAATVSLGGTINLLGAGTNPGILTLGAVNQYAKASTDGSSFASSGAVDNNGAIQIGANGTANSGTAPANATLNLASVIAGVPALKTALSAATVTVGAVAATANETNTGVQSGTYKIGSLSLDVTSPLVAGVYTQVNTLLTTVLAAVNAINVLPGAVTNLPSAVSLLAPLKTISSADGSITADLSTGVVHIDIRKITGLDLDNLNPNTNLTPAITAALTSQLLPAITKALTGTNGFVQNLTTQLGQVKVLGVSLSLLPALNPILTLLTNGINPIVSGLGSTVITPLATGISGLVTLTGNVEPTPPHTTPTRSNTVYSKAALSIGVVPAGNAATITLAGASVGPNAGPPVPTTTGLTPNFGPIAGGTLVTVTGTGFLVGATTVNVDGVSVPATVTSPTTLTFTTPAHAAGQVPVTVTTAGGTSTPSLPFTFGPPTIAVSGLSPNSGPVLGGTLVTVTGTGFVPGAGNTTVNVDSVNVPATATSTTQLTFTTPGHPAGPANITVQTAGGTSSPAQVFTYLPVPTIATVNGLNPTQGSSAGGTTVTVTGTGFVVGGTTVNVDGVNQTANATSTTTLTFVTKAHPAGPVPVTVQTNGGTSTPAQTYTFVDPPTIAVNGLSPNYGPIAGGTTVTVTGTGFVAGSTTVNVDGVGQPANVSSSTTLTFVTNAHVAGGVPVTVTTSGLTSAPQTFTFQGIPTLTALTPNTGPDSGGTLVTVTGSGFAPSATVNLDGIAQPTTFVNDTTLTFLTPPHAGGQVPVTVTTSGGTSTPLPFTFGPPTISNITGLSPNQGPSAGGTQITVTGTGFVPGATTINVDGQSLPANATSTTQLTFTTPAHSAGPVDVTAQTAAGKSGPQTFTFFDAPTILAVNGLSPDHGPVTGLTPVTVTGTGFVIGNTTVNVDGQSLPATVTSTTSLTFTTPPHAAGAVPVTVTTPGGTSGPQTYTFQGVPTITALSPNFGPDAGGTLVTVTGTGFSPSATVTIGGITVPANVVSDTTLQFFTPPHAGGLVAVTVTTSGGVSGPLPFTYGPPTIATIGGLTPNSGPVAGGTQVTVTGTGFVPGATTVNVDGVNQTANATSDTTLTFITNSHVAAQVQVTVQTAAGKSGPSNFTFVDVPTTSGLAPDSGPVTGNTTVTVTGTGFVVGNTLVFVDGVSRVGTVTSPTSLTFTTPAHLAGPANVTVQTPGGTSTPPLIFNFVPAPTATSLTPTSGPTAGNTPVTITGTGFVVGETTVTIGGILVPAGSVTVGAGGTTASFATPAHAAATVDVTVTTPGGAATLVAAYNYNNTAGAATLAPTSGPVIGGTQVIITGTGFVNGQTSVVIGGNAVPTGLVAVSNGGTTATFLTPGHSAGLVSVVASTIGGQDTVPMAYTYLDVPTTVTLSPTSGPVAGNTSVTIVGTGFVPGATTVTIGGNTVAATDVTVNGLGTAATFSTPAHPVPGLVTDVAVTTAGGTSTPGLSFTYLAIPTTTSLSPTSGPIAGNTPVTIIGSGFVPGATTVTIGGVTVPANLVMVGGGGTTALFATPAVATAGPVGVVVTTAGGPSTPALPFTYLNIPGATSLAPSSGPLSGNTQVIITGTGFVAGATTVTIGAITIPVGGVTVGAGGTTAQFNTPAVAVPGLVDVVATTAGGSTTPPLGFNYLPIPTANNLSPGSGPVTGGTQVVITGTGFVAGATSVFIGGQTVLAAGVQVNGTGTTATFQTPGHIAGTVSDVVVNTAGGVSTPALSFTYLPVPTAISLLPTSGPLSGNTLVTITGSGFVAGATTVTIGGIVVPANLVGVGGSGTLATFATPSYPLAGPVGVVVTTAGGPSTPPLTYTYLNIPGATSLAPTSGPVAGNTSVVITGTGFVAGATSVTIGNTTVPASGVTVNTGGTTATFNTPPAAIPGLVSVVATTAGGSTTTPLGFTYLPIPTLASLSPQSGPVSGGTSVTIVGSGFVSGATTVTIGGNTVPATGVTVNGTGTSATFATPAHPVAGQVNDVVVTTAGGVSTPALSFTYLPVPTAASLSPTSGPIAGNTPVTITGTGFVNGDTTVTIGGQNVPAALVTVNGLGTTASFPTPPHAAGLVTDVVATTSGGATSPLSYTYLDAPGAATLAPTSGPVTGGTQVTITGTGFVAGATSVAVGVNTVPASGVTVSNGGTTAVFFTPPSLVTGLVSVVATTAGGSTTTPLGFTYFAVPTTASLLPTSGPVLGGTSVSITGSGFVPGATSVTIGGATVPAASVQVNGAGTTATFSTPGHAVGTVNDVAVTTAGGTSTPGLAFTYLPIPTAATISPAVGPVTGNTSVTITGTGFVPGATTVTIGGNVVPFGAVTITNNGTTATFSTPVHPIPGVVTDVSVTTAGGMSAPPLSFNYVGVPTSVSLTPTSGPIAGGNTLVITGTGFVPGGTTVLIGGNTVPATAVAVTNGGTTASFPAPAHVAGLVSDITVTTVAGTSSPALAYTYLAVPTTVGPLSPVRGPATGGTVVTVNGTGFVPGATTVTIGGITVGPVGVTVNGAGTSLTFTTPPHAPGGVGVTVTTLGGTSAPALPFTYDALAAAGLSPDHGPAAGNTSVTITGTGFVPGLTSVTIGGVIVPAGLVTVNATGTSAVFNTPPHAPAGVLVTVTTPLGGTSNPLGYLYEPVALPGTSCVLTGVNPATGLDAATVTVLANVGINTQLVPSLFSVLVGSSVAGTPTQVTPLAGGFLQVATSVPVAVGTTSVSYRLAPQQAGVYNPVTGAPIPCTAITPVQRNAGIYFPLTPARLLDTRHGLGATQTLAPGATITLKVLGRGGIPATNVATVVLNVTVTEPVKAGYLTVYPGTSNRPNTSSINFGPKQTVANLVAAPVGSDGTVKIYNGSTGGTEAIADVAGYFSAGDTVAPGSYVPVTPTRLLDTSARVGVPTNTFVASGASVKLRVTGIGGVPATNVSAVTLNVTAAQPTTAGFITVYPSTSAKPYVSSLNFVKGATDANLVIAPVGTDGTVTLYNGSKGTVRLVADVSGFFRGGVSVLNGEYVAISPSRILDTRSGVNVSGKVGAGAAIAPTMVGRNGIPSSGVSAVVFNLTVTSTTGPGFITAYPNTLPLASNLNFVAKQDQPNAVISPVGSGGKIRLFNGSQHAVDLVSDVSGYFIKR